MKISDEEIIQALLIHKTQRKAAIELGVHYNTLSKRMQTEEFKSKYETAKKDLLETASNSLLQANDKAVDTLIDLLDSPNDSCRLGAAQKILTYSKDFYMFTNLTEKLDRVEQAIGEKL